jgi:hypothetical protein
MIGRPRAAWGEGPENSSPNSRHVASFGPAELP